MTVHLIEDPCICPQFVHIQFMPMKQGIVRDDLSVSDLFFLFDLSRIYLLGMNVNDENSSGSLQAGQPYQVYAIYSFHKYFRYYGESYYARCNPENKKRPLTRAEAENRA